MALRMLEEASQEAPEAIEGTSIMIFVRSVASGASYGASLGSPDAILRPSESHPGINLGQLANEYHDTRAPGRLKSLFGNPYGRSWICLGAILELIRASWPGSLMILAPW